MEYVAGETKKCHTDTDYSSCQHVPSVGLVVAGDVAYNDVHLYLADSNAQTRREWIAALDKLESLNPRAVIAGHKRPGNDDSPKIIEETRQYIRDFDRVAGQRRPREDSTTRCCNSVRIGSIPGERSGFRRARSHRNTSDKKQGDRELLWSTIKSSHSYRHNLRTCAAAVADHQ
jgi:hypothetical protein